MIRFQNLQWVDVHFLSHCLSLPPEDVHFLSLSLPPEDVHFLSLSLPLEDVHFLSLSLPLEDVHYLSLPQEDDHCLNLLRGDRVVLLHCHHYHP